MIHRRPRLIWVKGQNVLVLWGAFGVLVNQHRCRRWGFIVVVCSLPSARSGNGKKTRPARAQHAQIGHCSQAGRTLSRTLLKAHRSGRVLSRSPVPLVMSSRQLRLAGGGANHPMRTLTRYFTSGQRLSRWDSRDSVQRLEATYIHAHADRLRTYG